MTPAGQLGGDDVSSRKGDADGRVDSCQAKCAPPLMAGRRWMGRLDY